jgi:hypothetical protein
MTAQEITEWLSYRAIRAGKADDSMNLHMFLAAKALIDRLQAENAELQASVDAGWEMMMGEDI